MKKRQKIKVRANRRSAPKVARGRRSTVAGNDKKFALLKSERDEALARETAAAEVLKAISSSAGDLGPVFQSVLRNATQLCEAKFGVLYHCEGGRYRLVATHNTPQAHADHQYKRGLFQPMPGTTLDHLLETKKVIHSVDNSREKVPSPAAKLGGARSHITVPILKDNVLAGAIVIYRQEVRPVTDKQIELLQNFAAQAVIAIENARLLNELRGRTDDLSQRTDDLIEALEQQTATSEVLKVISSSPGELEPVFESLLANAVRICEAKFGNLALYDGRDMRMAAMHNAPQAYDALRRDDPVIPLDRSLMGPLVAAKNVVRFDDLAAAEPSASWGLVKVAGARSAVGVPMLKDKELVGAIVIYRTEPRPFADKQVELLTNFAAQAVIAIENTRLLKELRHRTDDLTEALEQQTATSEVLKVISSSPGELEPVFQAMLENATRICDAELGNLLLYADGAFRAVAMHGAPAEYIEARAREPLIRPSPATGLGRVAASKATAHIIDTHAERGYFDVPPGYSEPGLVKFAQARTELAVPMLKDRALVGAIIIYRQQPRPFTNKQIELVTNFAAQAVIAIENTRLLNELRQRTDDLSEALEQQTATSDVLRVISSSPGDLAPVFSAILENAVRICQANFGTMYLFEDGAFRAAAMHNVPPAFAAERARQPVVRPSRSNPMVRVAEIKRPLQIRDLPEDAGWPRDDAQFTVFAKLTSARGLTVVPMLKDDVLIGVVTVYRLEPRVFTDKQIELLTYFAAQAVIAIENTRLLNELRRRTDDLSESLEQQTGTSEVLKIVSSSPGNLEPVFESMLTNASRICRASYGTMFLREGEALRTVAIHGALPPAWTGRWQPGTLYQPETGLLAFQAVKTRRPVQVPDLRATPGYLAGKPSAIASADIAGIRTMINVPMLRDDEVIGVVSFYRTEVRTFTEKQIALVSNFAAQAVIAIENTRLLNELREALQQQTATADVLKVISRSTFDLKAVLNTLVESAARLSVSDYVTLNRQHDDGYRQVASYGQAPEVVQLIEANPLSLDRGTVVGRVIIAGKPVQIVDVLADPEFRLKEAARRSGTNTILGVPLLREGAPIGIMTLQRRALRSYTDKEIDLLMSFADQAVIAIENVRLFDEIQDKSRQLAEASQHKSQFLANMSHELRTPLNAILGYTELIIDGIYGETPEKAQTVLKRVESNGKHLLGLINDVLDLSKIEAGQLKLSLADYSIKDVVYSVVSAVEPLAAKKKLNFKVDVPSDIAAGHGDEQKLTQVLLNLTGNAIKFTDAGEVAIKVTSANGSYTVSIKDTGPGISAADQAKLFQQFQQADNSITKSKGGTGLGLAISKKIIELHGGSISVRSSVGGGSTFAFTLPITVERQAIPS